jgi:hypothetical protein
MAAGVGHPRQGGSHALVEFGKRRFRRSDALLLWFAASRSGRDFDGPSLAAHLNDGLIAQVRSGRGGGGGMRHGGDGMHRGGMHRGGMHGDMARAGGAYRGMHRPSGAGRYAGANRNVNRNVNRNINRAGYGGARYGNWARLGYGWRPGGAIAAGAAIGFVSAATAAAWAGPAPGPGLCWYYTDPSRPQGFWDACQ